MVRNKVYKICVCFFILLNAPIKEISHTYYLSLVSLSKALLTRFSTLYTCLKHGDKLIIARLFHWCPFTKRTTFAMQRSKRNKNTSVTQSSNPKHTHASQKRKHRNANCMPFNQVRDRTTSLAQAWGCRGLKFVCVQVFLLSRPAAHINKARVSNLFFITK